MELLDKDAVSDYLEKNRPDLVIHAAGIVGGIAANTLLVEGDIEDYTVAEIRALLARNSGE